MSEYKAASSLKVPILQSNKVRRSIDRDTVRINQEQHLPDLDRQFDQKTVIEKGVIGKVIDIEE